MGCFMDKLKQEADGRGWIAHETDGCVFCFTCFPGAKKFVEGCKILNAENRIGVNSDGFDGFDLCSRESDGGGEAAQRQDFSALGGELPIASQVDVVWVGNEVEFPENIFV